MEPPISQPLTALVADPNDVSRAGLCTVLGDDSRFAVVDEAASGVLLSAQRLQPDLIVLDPNDAGHLEVQLIAELAATIPRSHICIYTYLDKTQALVGALTAGAHVYLLKGRGSGGFLCDSLALVGRFGGIIIDPTIADHLVAPTAPKLTVQTPEPTAQVLSSREREVLAMVVEGASVKEVAARLHVGRTTVESYVVRLCDKVGARNRTHLAAVAARQGLVES